MDSAHVITIVEGEVATAVTACGTVGGMLSLVMYVLPETTAVYADPPAVFAARTR